MFVMLTQMELLGKYFAIMLFSRAMLAAIVHQQGLSMVVPW